VSTDVVGTPLTLLVDTGAPLSTLDQEIARALPAPSGVMEVGVRSQRVPLAIREVAVADQRVKIGFLAKDLTAMRPTGARGVLGNSLLMEHRLLVVPGTRAIMLG